MRFPAISRAAFLIAILAIAAALTSPAHADSLKDTFNKNPGKDNLTGPYVGAGGGRFNLKLREFEDNGAAINSIAQANDHAWTVFAGYRFTPYLSLEGAYIDFGQPSASYQAALASASGNYRVKLSGIAPNLVGTLPLGRVELFTKIGYYFYRLETRETAVSGTVIESRNNRADLLYGAGAGLNLFTHVNARVEYERLNIKNADDSDAFWLSAQWRF